MELTLEGLARIASVGLSALTLLFGALQWSSMRRRTKLKTDLEILRLLGDTGMDIGEFPGLKDRIRDRMERAYPPAPGIQSGLDRSDLFIGLLVAMVGTALLSYAGDMEDYWQGWFYGVGGALTLGGLFGVYKGFERKLR